MKNKTYARLSTLSLALLLAGTNANAQTIVPPSAEQFTFGNSNSQQVIIDPDRPELNAPWSMQIGALNQSVIDNREEDFPSHNTQVGINNQIKGSNNFQFGMSNQSDGRDNLQMGSVNVSEGQGNVQTGASQRALGNGNAQFGANSSTIEGDSNVQMGGSSRIRGNDVSTLGASTQGLSDGCVALGSESACREGTEVSIGDSEAGRTRRLTQVARGTLDQDAMTMEQGRAMAASLGGGSTYQQNGYFTAPIYVYQSGSTHYNVESALLDLDDRVYKIETKPVTPGTSGSNGASAYELAVKNGFQGNENAWLDSLRGLDGANAVGGSENPYIAINDDTTYDQNRPAEATGTNAIAAGNGARAVTKNYVGATAVGANSYAEGDQTTATGSDTIANGDFATATGSGAIATANAATASGANSRATEDGSTAVGTGASATAKGATAVGNVASAEHENSVAVGTGTVTSEANQVAVGNRKISQVAPGRIAKNSTDAINGSQLYDLNNEWNDKWSKTNDRISGMEGRMKQFDKKLHGVCAMQQANAQVAMSTAAIHGENRNRFGVGIGGCGGQAAFAAGYTRDVTTSRGSPSAFSVGISSSEAGTAVGAGWSIGW